MVTVDGHGTAGSSWIVSMGAHRSVVGGTAVAAGPTVRIRGHGIWHPAGRHLATANLGIGTVLEGGGGVLVGGPIDIVLFLTNGFCWSAPSRPQLDGSPSWGPRGARHGACHERYPAACVLLFWESVI